MPNDLETLNDIIRCAICKQVITQDELLKNNELHLIEIPYIPASGIPHIIRKTIHQRCGGRIGELMQEIHQQECVFFDRGRCYERRTYPANGIECDLHCKKPNYNYRETIQLTQKGIDRIEKKG